MLEGGAKRSCLLLLVSQRVKRSVMLISQTLVVFCRYGFKRVSNGPDKKGGVYSHPFFRRGRTDLLAKVVHENLGPVPSKEESSNDTDVLSSLPADSNTQPHEFELNTNPRKKARLASLPSDHHETVQVKELLSSQDRRCPLLQEQAKELPTAPMVTNLASSALMKEEKNAKKTLSENPRFQALLNACTTADSSAGAGQRCNGVTHVLPLHEQARKDATLMQFKAARELRSGPRRGACQNYTRGNDLLKQESTHTEKGSSTTTSCVLSQSALGRFDTKPTKISRAARSNNVRYTHRETAPADAGYQMAFAPFPYRAPYREPRVVNVFRPTPGMKFLLPLMTRTAPYPYAMNGAVNPAAYQRRTDMKRGVLVDQKAFGGDFDGKGPT
jgi:hypothetical protein